MSMNSQGRSTTPSEATPHSDVHTVSGSRGLQQREDLIFEMGATAKTGVDLPKPKGTPNRLGGVKRQAQTGLPGLSEPEAMRHYVRESVRSSTFRLSSTWSATFCTSCVLREVSSPVSDVSKKPTSRGLLSVKTK